jgi:hypothetical protein
MHHFKSFSLVLVLGFYSVSSFGTVVADKCSELCAALKVPLPKTRNDVYDATAIFTRKQEAIEDDIQTIETLYVRGKKGPEAIKYVKKILELTDNYRKLGEEQYDFEKASVQQLSGSERAHIEDYLKERQFFLEKDRVPHEHRNRAFYEKVLQELEKDSQK